MFKPPLLFVLIYLLVSHSTSAQDKDSTDEGLGEVKGSVEGLNETVQEMKTVLDALKKIKISGYIQAQFQSTDGSGDNPSAGSFSGGAFPAGTSSRFAVRRGRFKINYDNDLTQYVLEIDATQNGVAIKDAYAWIKEPWLRTYALTAGIFYRPFGFEVLHSHSIIESPEFSRAV